MIFATDKQIGIQVLPLDGNPYKIVCMIGHPEKVRCLILFLNKIKRHYFVMYFYLQITAISISNNKQLMFTIGYDDSCVLMWKIILRYINYNFNMNYFTKILPNYGVFLMSYAKLQGGIGESHNKLFLVILIYCFYMVQNHI